MLDTQAVWRLHIYGQRQRLLLSTAYARSLNKRLLSGAWMVNRYVSSPLSRDEAIETGKSP